MQFYLCRTFTEMKTLKKKDIFKSFDCLKTKNDSTVYEINAENVTVGRILSWRVEDNLFSMIMYD